MREVDKYILNFRGLLANNEKVNSLFFNTILINEQVFYEILRKIAEENLQKNGSPELTREEIVNVTIKSKVETVSRIIKELTQTNMFFKTKVEDTDEEYIGVTPQGHLIADVLVNDYRKN